MHEKLLNRIVLGENAVKTNSGFDYQALAGRMDYGTFYTIYVTLDEFIPPGSNTDNFTYTMSFHLQNFDGAISIGFPSNAVPTLTLNEDYDSSDAYCPHYFLNIEAQAFNTNFTIPAKDFNISENLKGKIIDVNIEMQFPANNIFNHNDLLKSPFLDPHMYVRDGERVLRLEYVEEANPDASIEKELQLEQLIEKFGEELANNLISYETENPEKGIINNLLSDSTVGMKRPFTTICYPRRVQVM